MLRRRRIRGGRSWRRRDGRCAPRLSRPTHRRRHSEPGAALALAITVPQQVLEPILTSVFLRYRHVNQAERWQRVEMQANGTVFSAEIPADYTQSPYALEYCFELRARRWRGVAGSGVRCGAFEPAVLRGDARRRMRPGMWRPEAWIVAEPTQSRRAGRAVCTPPAPMRYPDV